MTMVARKVSLLGVVEYRDEGEKMLKAAGDAVVVHRGTLRSVLMRCAEQIAAELDEIPWEVARAGHALARRGLAVCGAGRQRDWFALA